MKVQAKTMTESTERVIVAKPTVTKETLIVERQNIEVETVILLHYKEFMKNLCRITMMMKGQFKDSSHIKSGR